VAVCKWLQDGVFSTLYNGDMTSRLLLSLLKASFVLGSMGTAFAQQAAVANSAPSAIHTPHEDVKIPFELENRTIFVKVRAGNSRPYWFVVDTGWKYATIDLAVAKALGLKLGATVNASGGGKNTLMGNLLIDSPFRLVGLEDFSQPLFLALPLDDLAKRSGHEFAGILGTDFISEFVVEIDYLAKTMSLHDKMTYHYRGNGQSFPVTFNAAGWPEIKAAVIDGDRPAIEGTFVLDLGSGATLILNRPFVESEHFLRPDRHVVPWLEGQALGGGVDASVGRMTGLQIGRFFIKYPVTVFSHAATGPFASTASQGNIGAAILQKFKVILDYRNNRVILEPNARFDEPTDYNRSGLFLESAGENYQTFRIRAIADDSPASEAGLRPGDTLIAIDGQPVIRFSLSELRFKLQRAKACELLVERDGTRLNFSLKLHDSI
jgi:hypothetical protein